MTTALSNTVFHLTGKSSLQATTEQELETIANQYSYFVPAQLALAAKYKTNGSVKATTHLQKTGLLFNNPKWLQFQLMDLSSLQFAVKHKPVEPLLSNIAIPTMEEVKQMMEVADPKVISTATNPIVEELLNIIPDIVQQEIKKHQEAEATELSMLEEQEEVVAENIEVPQIDQAIAPPQAAEPQFTEPVLDNIPPPVQVAEEEIITAPTLEQYAPIEEIPTVQQEVIKEEVSVTDDIHSQIAKLKQDWHKPVEKEAALPFEAEPYYTIDYFASQGIKVDFSKDPQDKLTQKMLKFTDWLKKMKSINNTQLQLNNNIEQDGIEQAIQGIATASNQSKEIVTETMAQVFEKQGKIDKAIQLYIKLSFLNPEKTAYFASQIQKLKGIES